MRLDSLLRHVGQHGVSPAKGDHGSFAEKNAFLNHGVTAAQPKAQEKDRGRPQYQPDKSNPKRTRPGRLRMIRHGRSIIQYRFGIRFPMAADDKKFVSLPLASEKSNEGGTDND